MKWKPERKSEHGALGNHPTWKISKQEAGKQEPSILIVCTCHTGNAQDIRWIKSRQIIEEESLL